MIHDFPFYRVNSSSKFFHKNFRKLKLQFLHNIQNKTAYVAGWGMIKNGDSCFTNNFGPERHNKCRKYFEWKKKVREGCIHQSTPSSWNKRCRQFAEVISALLIH